MTVREYALKFTKLYKYVLSFVADSRLVCKVHFSVSYFVKECKDAMLIKELDMSWLMTYAEQVEIKKLQKMRMRKSKGAHFNGGFSHAKFSGCHFQQDQGSSKVLLKDLINVECLLLWIKVIW